MSLKKYIDQKNAFAKFFNEELMPAPADLTVQQIQRLAEQLETDMSPENFCCDGELRGAALLKKSRMLNTAQAELQALATQRGYKILEPWWEIM
jgi:hypothetical protein